MTKNPTIEHFEYADVCKVNGGFYKGCLVRILKRRLFGLFYRVTIINPYFGDSARIFGFRLNLEKKSFKG